MISLDMELIIKDIEMLGVKRTLEKHYILHGVLNSRLKSMGLSANELRTKAVLKAWNDGMDYRDIVEKFNFQTTSNLLKFVYYRRNTGWYVRDRFYKNKIRKKDMIKNDWNTGIPTSRIRVVYGFPSNHAVRSYVSSQRTKGEDFKYRDKNKIPRKDSDK